VPTICARALFFTNWGAALGRLSFGALGCFRALDTFEFANGLALSVMSNDFIVSLSKSNSKTALIIA